MPGFSAGWDYMSSNTYTVSGNALVKPLLHAGRKANGETLLRKSFVGRDFDTTAFNALTTCTVFILLGNLLASLKRSATPHLSDENRLDAQTKNLIRRVVVLRYLLA